MSEPARLTGQSGFISTTSANPHPARARAIATAHPEVRALIGRDPRTAGWTFGLVMLQFCVAGGLSLAAAPWWVTLLAAYGLGAFANHALTVLIHEYTHNLVFRSTVANRVAAILANLPIVVPMAMGFRAYHLLHHQHLGRPGLDADLPGEAEARWVGDRRWRRLLWVGAFPIILATIRTRDVRSQPILDAWSIVNVLVVAVALAPLLWLCGWTALAYLLLSTLFALGLHPVGARWFQEHYVVLDGQETYSYYGSLNRLSFNVGYHNEHHDFPGIAWSRLPRLRSIAHDYYEGLHQHRSWCTLLWHVLLSPEFRPYHRIVRAGVIEPARTDGTPAAARPVQSLPG